MCVMKRLEKASSQSALTSGAGIETDQGARGTVQSQARVQAARPEKADNNRDGESFYFAALGWLLISSRPGRHVRRGG